MRGHVPGIPIALTPFKPPDAARISRAIARTTATSEESKIDVVCDEELARAHGAGASSGVQSRTADIGPPRSLFAHGIAKAFELAATHIFEVGAIGTRGRCLIEDRPARRIAARFQVRPGAPA